MKTTDLIAALEADGVRPVPAGSAVSEAFVARLEQRLLGLDLTAADPTADQSADVTSLAPRRLRRISGIAAIAGTLTFVGAAAAAGIVITSRPDTADRATTPTSTVQLSAPSGATDRNAEREPAGTPAGAPVGVVASTTPSASTTDPTTSTTTSTTTTPATTAPSSSVPVPVAPPPPTTSAPSAEPTAPPPTPPPASLPPPASTEPAHEAPPSTPPPTTATTAPSTTTEVTVPATMTLACSVSAGAAITCTWSAGPSGTTRYLVLRSIPGSGQPGRAFSPAPGELTYVDAAVTPGTTYTYLVHAFADGPQSLGHTPPVSVGCCG